ncbi:hypothetical protein ABZ348_24205 [Streptomyces sp. NPDC005963]|uniref:hypothetical protein n=1 Tax=Streptomyces sp. NPDC005963 TaxID=3156721 RepID=UPI003406E41A
MVSDTTPPPGRRPGPKPRLSRERIVEAALGLGIEQVSINAVASALGAAPASLYRYIDSLDDLLFAALERAFAHAPLPSGEQGWRPYLETEATTRFELLTRYAGLLTDGTGGLETAAVRRFEQVVEGLVPLGFGVDDAVLAVDAVLDLIHDGAAQIAHLRARGHGDPAAQPFESPDVSAAFRRIQDAPRDHLWRKLAIVLDGLAVRQSGGTPSALLARS